MSFSTSRSGGWKRLTLYMVKMNWAAWSTDDGGSIPGDFDRLGSMPRSARVHDWSPIDGCPIAGRSVASSSRVSMLGAAWRWSCRPSTTSIGLGRASARSSVDAPLAHGSRQCTTATGRRLSSAVGCGSRCRRRTWRLRRRHRPRRQRRSSSRDGRETHGRRGRAPAAPRRRCVADRHRSTRPVLAQRSSTWSIVAIVGGGRRRARVEPACPCGASARVCSTLRGARDVRRGYFVASRHGVTSLQPSSTSRRHAARGRDRGGRVGWPSLAGAAPRHRRSRERASRSCCLAVGARAVSATVLNWAARPRSSSAVHAAADRSPCRWRRCRQRRGVPGEPVGWGQAARHARSSSSRSAS